MLQRSEIEALGKIGDSRALPVLQELLYQDSFWYQSNVEEALERIGSPEALEVLGKWKQGK